MSGPIIRVSGPKGWNYPTAPGPKPRPRGGTLDYNWPTGK